MFKTRFVLMTVLFAVSLIGMSSQLKVQPVAKNAGQRGTVIPVTGLNTVATSAAPQVSSPPQADVSSGQAPSVSSNHNSNPAPVTEPAPPASFVAAPDQQPALSNPTCPDATSCQPIEVKLPICVYPLHYEPDVDLVGKDCQPYPGCSPCGYSNLNCPDGIQPRYMCIN